MDNVAIATRITASLFGFSNTCPDDPYGGSSGVGITIPGWGNGVWGTQIVFDYNGRAPFFRTFFSFGQSVGDWIKLATATPPQEFDLPLAEGLSDVSSAYWKDQFGVVTGFFNILANSVQSGYDITIGTLPEGFRPSRLANSVGVVSSGECLGLTVRTTGEIQLRDAASVTLEGKYIKGLFSFVAAS